MSYNPNDNKQPYSSLTSEKGLEAEPAYTAGFQAGLSARGQKKEGCFKASFCGYFRRRGRQFSVFKREYVEEMLANNFPKRTLIVSAIIIFFMSITAFSLQVTMIAKRAPYFRPGAGIWVGILFAIFEIFTLLLICKRKRSLLLVTYGLHVFGLILSSVGLFVVNYYGVSRPCYDKDHLDFSDCKNSRFFGFNVAMFVIAGFYFVSCLAEIISIRRRLNQSREKILGNQEASAPIV